MPRARPPARRDVVRGNRRRGIRRTHRCAAARAPARPRSLLVTGLVGLALFALFGVAVLQDVEAPFTQPLDDAWRRLVGASATRAGELGGADVLPVPRRAARRGADDPADPGVAVRDPPLALGAVLPHRRARRQHGRLAVDEEPRRPAASRPTTSRTACSARCSGRPRFIPLGACSERRHPARRGRRVLPPSKRLVWWIVGGADRRRHDLAAHPHQRALVLGRRLRRHRRSVATLVLWWAFSTLLAKDYGKPLFRRRIESPAHEGAS